MENIKNLDFGSIYKRTKDSLIELAIRIADLKTILDDPEYVIDRCFTKLRNEIDLEKEEFSYRVEKHFQVLIDEVNMMESICKNESKSIVEKSCDFKEITNKNKYLKEELNKPKIDFAKWKEIGLESEENTINLKRLVQNIQDDLIKNNRYKLHNSMKDVVLKTSIYKEPIIKNELFDEYGIIPKRVSIKFYSTGKFIEIKYPMDSSIPLKAEGCNESENTVFEIIYPERELDKNVISLRSLINRKMISAVRQELTLVENLEETEKFYVHFENPYCIGLKSKATGKFLTGVPIFNKNTLNWNGNYFLPWEKCRIVPYYN